MTLDKVKEVVRSNKGIERSFRFKGTRNQIDEFSGTIIDMYQAIFIISVNDNGSKIKSFSYSDLLTESLEIIN